MSFLSNNCCKATYWTIPASFIAPKPTGLLSLTIEKPIKSPKRKIYFFKPFTTNLKVSQSISSVSLNGIPAMLWPS
jgi:hypothetical protein